MYSMAARAASGRDNAACFSCSAAVASACVKVKQGGIDKAECYPACRLHVEPALGGVAGTLRPDLVFKRPVAKKMSVDLFSK